jgi:hypothetical protein
MCALNTSISRSPVVGSLLQVRELAEGVKTRAEHVVDTASTALGDIATHSSAALKEAGDKTAQALADVQVLTESSKALVDFSLTRHIRERFSLRQDAPALPHALETAQS